MIWPELRATPVYVHHDTGGYDGLHYAQMSVNPALRDPAMDGLPYRARRILLSWLADGAGLGDPGRIVQACAARPVLLWFGLAWVQAGNRSVFSGLFIFWLVPQGTHELAAGRVAAGMYVFHSDDKWYPAEHGRDKVWAWCSRTGGVVVELWPCNSATLNLRVAVRGSAAQSLEIRQEGRRLWPGEIGAGLPWIARPAVPITEGRAHLEFSSSAPPCGEAPRPVHGRWAWRSTACAPTS